ncbi:hypothetical protein GWK47_015493 [Chionoecetes opilio]|uniref:Uncharacterized protein n=1 Tax=Chionoecetes opilio TaxID=41210 RepID=A0A8J5CKL7_CHIOP|nr:hypothetical protein GWK47_015493 [Chionoecetes opilio]
MVRVPLTEGFETPYTLIDAIEDVYPELNFTARPGRDNDFLLHPKDEETLAALLSLTSVNSKPVKLHLVQPTPPKITGIGGVGTPPPAGTPSKTPPCPGDDSLHRHERWSLNTSGSRHTEGTNSTQSAGPGSVGNILPPPLLPGAHALLSLPRFRPHHLSLSTGQEMRYMQRPSRHLHMSREIQKKGTNHIVLPHLRAAKLTTHGTPNAKRGNDTSFREYKVKPHGWRNTPRPHQEPSHGALLVSPAPHNLLLPTSSRSFHPYLLPRSRHDKINPRSPP